MSHATNPRYCPVCDGYLDYEGICHTCGFHERQYADPKDDHPRAVRPRFTPKLRTGCL